MTLRIKQPRERNEWGLTHVSRERQKYTTCRVPMTAVSARVIPNVGLDRDWGLRRSVHLNSGGG